jgi:hypothetical protein
METSIPVGRLGSQTPAPGNPDPDTRQGDMATARPPMRSRAPVVLPGNGVDTRSSRACWPC